jgi:hypothetical protein
MLDDENFWYKNWHSRLALAKKRGEEGFEPKYYSGGVEIQGQLYDWSGTAIYSGIDLGEPRSPPDPLPLWLQPKQEMSVYKNIHLIDYENEVDGSGQCLWTGEQKCESGSREVQWNFRNHILEIGSPYSVWSYKVIQGILVIESTLYHIYFDLINEPYWYKDNLSKLILADKMEEEGHWRHAAVLRRRDLPGMSD